MMNNNEKIILDNELEAVAGGAGGYRYHIVVKGDTMGAIAAKYGTTLENLKRLNPQITNVNLIYPGDAIRVA